MRTILFSCLAAVMLLGAFSGCSTLCQDRQRSRRHSGRALNTKPARPGEHGAGRLVSACIPHAHLPGV